VADTEQDHPHKAVLIKASNTEIGGHCLWDAVLQGLQSHGPLQSSKSFIDLRRDSSQWALKYPTHPVQEHLSLAQYLASHLNNTDLSHAQYMEWWTSVLSTDLHAAESPSYVNLAVYLDTNVFVWSRPHTMTDNLVLNCVFGAPSRQRQIHLLRDPNNNSLRDQTAHISLITQLAFRDRGALYCTGTDDKPPHDWRVPHTPFLVSDQPGELERGKYFATIAVIQPPRGHTSFFSCRKFYYQASS
jgi:hypothetical protein